MKFTLSWLQDYLKGDYTLKDIEEALVSIGLEVESITNEAERLKDFITATITETRRHPEADRLQICTVDTGSGVIDLVCGGKNARSGIHVVLARVGVTIPSTGQVLKAGKVRGIESPGMLCSSDELLIDVPCDGILELETDLPAGSPAAIALGLTDPIIDIAITPNRSDCFAISGIARDLYAYFLSQGKDVSLVSTTKPSIRSEISFPLTITNNAPQACYHFGLTLINNVKNASTHECAQQIRSRLTSIGLRSISPLVDITNYLCIDRGRPLHVFDADKIKGNIVLRLSKTGETFEALDEKTYTLNDDMLVICDDEGIISLAGIMGGMRTGCDDKTTNVLVESAWFDPISIARTGQKLSIISDSRMRFERGVDPLIVEEEMARAVHMVQTLCNDATHPCVISDTHWVKSDVYPYVERAVTLTQSKLERVTGEILLLDDYSHHLEALGFEKIPSTPNTITVKVPSWRSDVSDDIDIVEEIVRIRGTDAIQEIALPLPSRHTKKPDAKTTLAKFLVNLGYVETINFSFINKETAAFFGNDDQLIHLKNPITAELTTMRPSLLPSLLRVASDNQKRDQETIPLFEIACVYGSHLKDRQVFHATALWAGKNHPPHWNHKQDNVSVFDVKDHLINLLSEFGMKESNLQISTTEIPSYYHPGRSGALKQGNRILGYFGEIHPTVMKHINVSGKACGFELFIEHLPELRQKRGHSTLSPYQPVERDFAFLLDESFNVGKLAQVLSQKLTRQATFPKHVSLECVDVFDVFALPEQHQKSVAVRLRFQPEQATLSETDLEHLMTTVTTLIKNETGGILRQ